MTKQHADSRATWPNTQHSNLSHASDTSAQGDNPPDLPSTSWLRPEGGLQTVPRPCLQDQVMSAELMPSWLGYSERRGRRRETERRRRLKRGRRGRIELHPGNYVYCNGGCPPPVNGNTEVERRGGKGGREKLGKETWEERRRGNDVNLRTKMQGGKKRGVWGGNGNQTNDGCAANDGKWRKHKRQIEGTERKRESWWRGKNRERWGCKVWNKKTGKKAKKK